MQCLLASDPPTLPLCHLVEGAHPAHKPPWYQGNHFFSLEKSWPSTLAHYGDVVAASVHTPTAPGASRSPNGAPVGLTKTSSPSLNHYVPIGPANRLRKLPGESRWGSAPGA